MRRPQRIDKKIARRQSFRQSSIKTSARQCVESLVSDGTLRVTSRGQGAVFRELVRLQEECLQSAVNEQRLADERDLSSGELRLLRLTNLEWANIRETVERTIVEEIASRLAKPWQRQVDRRQADADAANERCRQLLEDRKAIFRAIAHAAKSVSSPLVFPVGGGHGEIARRKDSEYDRGFRDGAAMQAMATVGAIRASLEMSGFTIPEAATDVESSVRKRVDRIMDRADATAGAE